MALIWSNQPEAFWYESRTYVISKLGAPEDFDQKAWDTYLKSLRDGVAQSWNRARRAYQALEKTRASLSLSLLARPGEGASPGALSQGEQANFMDAGALAHLLVTWMDEALAGKRKVGWDEANGTLVVEGLPGDAVRVVVDGGRPRIVSASTGQPVPVTPTDGTIPDALSAAPLVWIAVAVVAVAASAYFIVEEVCEGQVEVAKQRTMETLGTQQHERVMAGKATPEQSQKMTDAVYAGAAAVETASAAARASESETGLQKTVRTLAWVTLGVGVIYLAAKVIPAVGSPARATA